MKTRIIQYLFLLFPVSLFGSDISGTITNANTHLPVEFATVYINGTTIGTLSDINGIFTLSYEHGSCQIVISHTSYQNKVIELNSDSVLSIQLVPKIIQIQQASIKSQNLRNQNLKYFEDIFLGSDFWGKNATIKNDSVITFIVEYYDEKTTDINLIGKPKYFEVQTSAPLIIDMPKLGYILEYDLVRFSEKYNSDLDAKTISSLGYYYFKPVEPISKKHLKKYTKNRHMAYYNSTMHLIRSLYANKLSKNGYLLYQVDTSKSSMHVTNNPFDFEDCNCLKYFSNEACLTGLKGYEFIIKYYGIDYPINVAGYKSSGKPSKDSYLFILNDSCTIRKDGTLPGGQIVFSNSMVKKRIGASLPSDYAP